MLRIAAVAVFLAISVSSLFGQSSEPQVSEPVPQEQRNLRVFSNTDGTGTASRIPVWVDTDSLGDSVIRHGAGGWIGIGTDSILRRLTVDAASTNGGMSVIYDAAANAPYFEMLLNTTATPYGIIQAADSISWRNLALNPNGGNVGIRTAAPMAPLHVFSSPTSDSWISVGTDPNAGPALNVGYAGNSYGRARVSSTSDLTLRQSRPTLRCGS